MHAMELPAARSPHCTLDRANSPVGARTWSLYFFDPNGIRLEFSWQEDDAGGPHVAERWTQTREEALAELRSVSGDPAWLGRVTAHLPERREAAS